MCRLCVFIIIVFLIDNVAGYVFYYNCFFYRQMCRLCVFIIIVFL